MKLYMYYIYRCTFDIFPAHWKPNRYVTYKLSTFVLCILISKICWNIRFAYSKAKFYVIGMRNYVEVQKPMLQTFQYHMKCMLCPNNPPFQVLNQGLFSWSLFVYVLITHYIIDERAFGAANEVFHHVNGNIWHRENCNHLKFNNLSINDYSSHYIMHTNIIVHQKETRIWWLVLPN